ncbi:hypothetical protein HZ994_10950 [Akkermansiaceae bacterium]|nr:hypothetical protein HZ994_10950 [Akkermansiaceae bacterium]
MKSKLSFRQFALLSTASIALFGLSSCLPLAAGAAVGYVAHDEGYRVQNPIKKR